MAFTNIPQSTLDNYKCSRNNGIDGLSAITLDTTDGNTIPYNSNQTLVFQETGGTNPFTVTVSSNEDSDGKSKTQTLTIAANGYGILPPLDNSYNDSGFLELTVSGTGTGVLVPVIFPPL